MTSIHIFDIESETWIEQPVTDINGQGIGTSAQYNGTNIDLPETLPPPRMSACIGAGSLQDKTSHTVASLGGQNEETALGEVWLLSLPRSVAYFSMI
jgi:hypothetical protein